MTNELILDKKILLWLKTKKNYIYYKKDEQDNNFSKQLAELLLASRISINDLETAPFYLLTTTVQENETSTLSQYNYSLHNKHKFNNYNVFANEYIYDMSLISAIIKNYTNENTENSRNMIFALLHNIKHTKLSKNKFISQKEKFSFKYLYSSIDIKDIELEITNMNDNFNNILNDFDHYQASYLDNVQSVNKYYDEVGIFYPFKIDHNIFENKHYLLEMNPIKFNRQITNTKSLIDNFYYELEIGKDSTKKNITLEHYFIHPGSRYFIEFAYFDPIKFYRKYKHDLEYIYNKTKNSEQSIFDLFELLNLFQYESIEFMHTNLINMISVNRSKNRSYTFSEYIKKERKLSLASPKEYDNFYCFVLDILIEVQYKEGTELEGIESLQGLSDSDKLNIQNVIDDILKKLGKKNSSMQHLLNHYKIHSVKNYILEYKLNKKSEKIIERFLKSIITFYNDEAKEKFSNKINSTLISIYSKKQHVNLKKQINSKFQKEFILKYRHKYDKYRHKYDKYRNY